MKHLLKYSLAIFFLFSGLQISYCQNNISEENKKAIEILKNSTTFKTWKAKNKVSDDDIVYLNINIGGNTTTINFERKSAPNLIHEYIINNASKEVERAMIEDLR
jgi:hypothetical protein